MPVIGWDEGSPQGSDSLGQGDEVIKSLRTSIRVGLDGEHIWPSGGGDAGVHRLGSARPYIGAQSLVSSTGSDGRLMLTSDTSRLFGVGSGGTSFIGGPTVISAGSYPGGAPPQRFYWAMEFGIGQTKSGLTNITFPSTYSGRPFVWVTGVESIAQEIMTIDGITNVSINVRSSHTDGAGNSNATFCWMSIGTRAF